MDAKYFTCNHCRFTFTRTVMPEQCPDCGKHAVRPATKEETEEAIARQEEFSLHGDPLLVTRKEEK